jgi:hypothetical protein
VRETNRIANVAGSLLINRMLSIKLYIGKGQYIKGRLKDDEKEQELYRGWLYFDVCIVDIDGTFC